MPNWIDCGGDDVVVVVVVVAGAAVLGGDVAVTPTVGAVVAGTDEAGEESTAGATAVHDAQSNASAKRRFMGRSWHGLGQVQTFDPEHCLLSIGSIEPLITSSAGVQLLALH